MANIDDFRIPYASAITGGGWFTELFTAPVIGTATLVQGKGYITPIFLGRNKTQHFTQIGVHVSTGGGGGSVVRLGVFQLDENNGLLPNQLLVDAGTVGTTGTGNRAIAINLTLSNVPWIGAAVQAEGSASGPHLLAMDSSPNGFFPPILGYKDGDISNFANRSLGLADTTTVADGAFETVFANFAPMYGSFPYTAVFRLT